VAGRYRARDPPRRCWLPQTPRGSTVTRVVVNEAFCVGRLPTPRRPSSLCFPHLHKPSTGALPRQPDSSLPLKRLRHGEQPGIAASAATKGATRPVPGHRPPEFVVVALTPAGQVALSESTSHLVSKGTRLLAPRQVGGGEKREDAVLADAEVLRPVQASSLGADVAVPTAVTGSVCSPSARPSAARRDGTAPVRPVDTQGRTDPGQNEVLEDPPRLPTRRPHPDRRSIRTRHLHNIVHAD
jgi:hypothetical protein